MKKIAVIANRNAGRGRAIEAIQNAKRTLWGWPVEVLCPESREELRRTCQELKPEEYEAAVVIGGDGTINQALRAMAGSEVPLLPFPGGTANDFAAELGLRPDWEQVQSLIDARSFEPVDLIEANGVPFATVAGMGVGAILTAELNERREKSVLFQQGLRRLQSEIYTVLSAKTVVFRSDYIHNLHIRSNVFNERVRTAAVFVCNQDRLAGNLRVAQSSDNGDEVFSVLVIPQHRSWELIPSLIKLKLGKLSSRDFILFSTREVSIKDLDGRPVAIFGDGETLVQDTSVIFRTRPQAIRVYKGRRDQERAAGGNRK